MLLLVKRGLTVYGKCHNGHHNISLRAAVSSFRPLELGWDHLKSVFQELLNFVKYFCYFATGVNEDRDDYRFGILKT